MKFLDQHKTSILLAAAICVLYAFYVYDLTGNPPGFYIDESIASYNAYTIYLTGQGEFGHSWPLYFPVLRLPPPHDYLGYADPTQIYALAALYLVFPPSLLLSRLLSATAMFVAAMLLGRLASRISNRLDVGVAVGLTALLTPWLFEVGRLAFGASLYPFVVVLFLSALYSAHKRGWSTLNILGLAATLALLTYTYSIGRLLGPLLAFGLIIFTTDRDRLKDVLKTWVAFGITLVPMLVFHLRNPGALAGRFNMTVGVITPDKSYGQIFLDFVANYAENISPRRLLFVGDPNLRHHITDTPAILVVTLSLAIIGIFIVLQKHRKDAWWRFVLFGLVASVIPSSLTRDPFHMLRLTAFPVFLITLTVPALLWLFGSAENKTAESTMPSSALKRLSTPFTAAARWIQQAASPAIRRAIGIALLLLTILQAVFFQITFREVGPKRGLWFDDAYPRVFAAAIANPSRPIYLVDGYWGQAYIHAYWYAITQKIDLSNFVHLREGERAPAGAVVLSSEEKCSNCEMILKDPTYILYRVAAPVQPNPSPTPVVK